MVYSCKDSHEDKSVTEKEFTYGFEEAAQWISLAAAYDRDCQWLRFICLVFLGIKGLKTNQWFLPHLLIWLYGSLFQIHIKIWMSEKRAFVESRFHCAWEGKEIPRCLRGRARERKNAGDHRPRRQALSASQFFSPSGASLWTGPVDILCHIHIPVPLIREACCIFICCGVHIGHYLRLAKLL